MDLNSQPIMDNSTGSDETIDPPQSAVEQEIQNEVHKTVTLGRKLGAQLQSFKDLIKEAVVNEGEISKGCGSAFITLIPKVDNPILLKDFRPITLIGIISKVISKVLAERIKKVLNLVISETQSAFLKDRFILDGPLVVNEVLAWLKKKKCKAFLFKIDFEKAYDNVNWLFLLSIREQMGFPDKWRGWIRGVLKSSRSAILVNGAPTFEFNAQKGLRQGDPLSPFLFLIVMEALSCMIDKAAEMGEFQGIKFKDESWQLTHLFYADDAMIVGKGIDENVEVLARILRCFYVCSGLEINLNKSNFFGIGLEEQDVTNNTMALGCRRGTYPFDYLGIRVGTNMHRCNNWSTIIEVFEKRLSGWKAKTLSIGGRITIIKSVLVSLPIYYLSLYKAPCTVTETLERLMKRFLWSGNKENHKTNCVAWDRVTLSKKEGGLGVPRLKEVNEALMFKWGFRFRKDVGSMWKKIILSYHTTRNRFYFLPMNKDITGKWKTIVQTAESLACNNRPLYYNMQAVIGDGRTVRFWMDTWLGDSPLHTKYPRLFENEEKKFCSVADRMVRSTHSWSLNMQYFRGPWDVIIGREVMGLEQDVGGLVAGNTARDDWRWKAEDKDVFSVKAVKNLLQKNGKGEKGFVFKWVSWVPIKCNVLAWRAEMGRLPVKKELAKRNIHVESLACPFCDWAEESAEHILTGCAVTMEVWYAVVPVESYFDFRDKGAIGFI